MTTTPALPSWLKPMNAVVIGLARLGIPLGPSVTLTVAGRTSGRPQTTPVTPITVGERRYVIAALPESDWARNLRAAAGRAEMARGRRAAPVTLHEITDAAAQAPVLRTFPVQARGGVPFYVRLGLVTGPDPDQFAALAGQVAVFEIR